MVTASTDRDFADAVSRILQDMLDGYDDGVRPSRKRLEYMIEWAKGRKEAD